MSSSHKRSFLQVSSAADNSNPEMLPPPSKTSSNDSEHNDGFVLGSRLSSLPSLCMDQQALARKLGAPPSDTKANSNSSLFGRVMQQSSSHLQTPTKQRQPPASSFLSPGGFKLRNAVDAAVAASPLCLNKRLDGENSRDGSVAPLPAWRRAEDIEAIPMDWSIKEKLILNSPILEPSSFRWVQRRATDRNDTWPEACTYWQYPLPVPNSETHNIRPPKLASGLLSTEHSMTGIGGGNSKMVASRLAAPTPSELARHQLQMPPHPTLSMQQQTWQACFTSLYQSWRLNGTPYFYARGTDHTILFLHQEGEPRILLSSCDKAFREWCKSQDVTLYVESKPLEVEQWSVATEYTPPSPGSAAELAALRRAQVLKKTAGADVSVSFRQSIQTNITQQRRAWQQVPAIEIVGVDDCAAVAEYYRNTATGTILPILLAPQPFVGASMQVASVRWARAGRLEIEGFLLPSKLRQMVKVLLERVQSIVDDNEDEDEIAVRLEASYIAAKATGQTLVRPLEDIVVGQACLWALQGEQTTSISADTVSQVVWDSDEPDALSYKVTPGAV